MNCLPELPSNHNPPDLSLPGSWNYRRKPLALGCYAFFDGIFFHSDKLVRDTQAFCWWDDLDGREPLECCDFNPGLSSDLYLVGAFSLE
jgi:hypothetical protein